MPPAVSVIIPTRNRAGILKDSLPTVLDQDLPEGDFEVIVIDDDSPDDTAALLGRFDHPRLRWETLPRSAPGAISRARNRAISLARGAIIASIDDDAFVAPDWLAAHLSHHASGPEKIVTGPIIDIREPPTDIEADAREAKKGWHRNPYPSGNASAPKALLDRIGGYDEAFTHYGWEDLEIGRRLRAAGAVPVYELRAAILHYKPRSAPRSFADRLRTEIQRGSMGEVFHRKHRQFEVAVMTKRIAPLRALDAGLNALLGLDARLDRVLATGAAPDSRLMQFLLLEHAEISGPRLLEKLEGTAP